MIGRRAQLRVGFDRPLLRQVPVEEIGCDRRRVQRFMFVEDVATRLGRTGQKIAQEADRSLSLNGNDVGCTGHLLGDPVAVESLHFDLDTDSRKQEVETRLVRTTFVPDELQPGARKGFGQLLFKRVRSMHNGLR